MKKNNIFSSITKYDFSKFIFVFTAFALMALTAYFSVGKIMRDRLLNRAEEMISTIEANIRVGLSEAETALLNSYYTLSGMIQADAAPEDILMYFNGATEWMRKHNQGLFDFIGISGFINGDFYNCYNRSIIENFNPYTLPWYYTALQSGSNVAYTNPYLDERNGYIIVSAIRNIYINGEKIGVLIIDINISRFADYAESLSLASDGYGLLLSENFILIAYPNDRYLGSRFQELGSHYEEITNILRRGGNLYAHRITDIDDNYVITFFSRIFNGWYIGIITPYYQFYRDLYIAAFALILLGLTFSIILSVILFRLSYEKVLADKDSKSKTSFLANMSHEIRTPMNAIIGMAEILLRGELSDEARGYAQDIKQAGNNLITIINDILDFSKIEAGKLEIHSDTYLFSSLINDTVNIIRARLMEKPIRFFTNIDSAIPSNLFGDEVRLRQILLNLLSNAVKYSERGNIILTITLEKRDVLVDSKVSEEPNVRVWLKFVISDTGYGIKPESLEKLFDDFIQVDVNKRRKIEGTGLGLAITKRLCTAMGGSIKAESVYGKGSTFTVTIPQGVSGEEPFAAVKDTTSGKLLVYERRNGYSESICWSLRNLNVPHLLVYNDEAFADALQREKWFYVLAGYGLYNRIREVMERIEFPNYKKPSLILMVEWGIEARIPNVQFISLPIQTLSIAKTLNGEAGNKDYLNNRDFDTRRFTLPSVRLLVVDDIATNLKVAEGLLAPYGAIVDTCLSGAEAIELIKRKTYDLVFMDHMMPEMDGIEAVAFIRDWEEEQLRTSPVPIIALTANAVMGMREMFIKNGFDDFLAKPIDVPKLDELLDYWIPSDKKIWGTVMREDDAVKKEKALLFSIPDVDTKYGLESTGGTIENYRKVLLMFCRDALERLPALQTSTVKEDISSFITQVHAIKSASSTIGANEISEQSAALETAGRKGDFEYIETHLHEFVDNLEKLIKNIQNALKPEEDSNSLEDTGYPSLFRDLASALSSQDLVEIDRIMEYLNNEPLDQKTKEVLDRITSDILIAEYENAVQTINEMLGMDMG